MVNLRVHGATQLIQIQDGNIVISPFVVGLIIL